MFIFTGDRGLKYNCYELNLCNTGLLEERSLQWFFFVLKMSWNKREPQRDHKKQMTSITRENHVFLLTALFKTLFIKDFFLFFFKPGQAALIDVFVPVWKSDLTSRKSLVCLVHLSLQYQPQFWAVSSEFWSRINRWTSLFEGHRALFLSIKPKVAAWLVLKCSRVVNSLSYSLTVFIVCARAEANVPL